MIINKDIRTVLDRMVLVRMALAHKMDLDMGVVRRMDADQE